MANALKEKLDRDEVALGFTVVYPSASILECIGAEWDWLWLDWQHSEHDYRSLLECVCVAEARGVPPIVRVPGHEYGIVGPANDMCPAGLMVPMVDTPEQARAVVEATRFPPLGRRSIGSLRAVTLQGLDYAYKANEDVLLVAQIETKLGVSNVEAIAATEGVSGVLVGSVDLKLDMGIPLETPDVEADEIMKAMETVARAARNAGKFAGCLAFTPEAAKRTVQMGYRLLGGGVDSWLMQVAAATRLEELRAALGA